jgi:serine O-acetyltransferase
VAGAEPTERVCLVSTSQALFCDAGRYTSGPVNWATVVRLFMTRPGFRASCSYRVAHSLRAGGAVVLPKVLERVILYTCLCTISSDATLGEALLLPHPIGIVIGAGTVTGRGCTIQQSVSLGGNYDRLRDGRSSPTLGDDVALSAGAVVVGPLNIGDRTLVGANVVVTRDVGPDVVLKSAPAIEIQKQQWKAKRDTRAGGG